MNCNICRNSFDSVDFYIKHLNLVHKLRDYSDTFKCPINNCPSNFGQKGKLKRHIQSCLKYSIDSLKVNEKKTYHPTVSSKVNEISKINDKSNKGAESNNKTSANSEQNIDIDSIKKKLRKLLYYLFVKLLAVTMSPIN